MSFFGGSAAPKGPSPLFSAKTDLDMYTDMFQRMSTMCSKKCVTKFHDQELAIGEMTCVDRCVGKYLSAQAKVGEVLQAFEAQMKNQEGMMPGQLPKQH